MRHARPDDLENINSLMKELRNIAGIREKQTGHLYFKGKNVIHFHMDQDDIYADIGDSRIKLTFPVDKDQSAVIVEKVRHYMFEITEESKKH
jgi:hypothetical protein